MVCNFYNDYNISYSEMEAEFSVDDTFWFDTISRLGEWEKLA